MSDELNAYPPFLGAGIRVTKVSEDLRHFRAEMKLTSLNRNFVGTHFGGSLYSMCDPFFMIMVIEALGDSFIVWDKSASIRFRKPGRGRVHADFRLEPADIDGILEIMKTQEKYERTFKVEVKDDEGQVIAEVEKLIYVRRKEPK